VSVRRRELRSIRYPLVLVHDKTPTALMAEHERNYINNV